MFNKSNVQALLADLRPALQQIAHEHGAEVKIGTARYTNGSIRLTVNFDAATDSGEPVDFKACALLLKLPEDCWDTTIGIGMKSYRITGINLRRRKYPVSLERKNPDGSVDSIKMTADRVRELLGA